MDYFYLFLVIFILNDGFTMSRHYCSYLRNLREKIIEKITYGWWISIHSVIDIGSIIGMMVYFEKAKHFWVAISIPIVIILWYIPLGWKKYRENNSI